MIADDIKCICSLREAIELLIAYATDELESEGHGIETGTALVLTIQRAEGIHENVVGLEEQLAERASDNFNLHFLEPP